MLGISTSSECYILWVYDHYTNFTLTSRVDLGAERVKTHIILPLQLKCQSHTYLNYRYFAPQEDNAPVRSKIL